MPYIAYRNEKPEALVDDEAVIVVDGRLQLRRKTGKRTFRGVSDAEAYNIIELREKEKTLK